MSQPESASPKVSRVVFKHGDVRVWMWSDGEIRVAHGHYGAGSSWFPEAERDNRTLASFGALCRALAAAHEDAPAPAGEPRACCGRCGKPYTARSSEDVCRSCFASTTTTAPTPQPPVYHSLVPNAELERLREIERAVNAELWRIRALTETSASPSLARLREIERTARERFEADEAWDECTSDPTGAIFERRERARSALTSLLRRAFGRAPVDQALADAAEIAAISIEAQHKISATEPADGASPAEARPDPSPSQPSPPPAPLPTAEEWAERTFGPSGLIHTETIAERAAPIFAELEEARLEIERLRSGITELTIALSLFRDGQIQRWTAVPPTSVSSVSEGGKTVRARVLVAALDEKVWVALGFSWASDEYMRNRIKREVGANERYRLSWIEADVPLPVVQSEAVVRGEVSDASE